MAAILNIGRYFTKAIGENENYTFFGNKICIFCYDKVCFY